MIQGRLILLKGKERTIQGELDPDRPGSVGMDGKVCSRGFQTAVDAGQEKKKKRQSEKNGRVPEQPVAEPWTASATLGPGRLAAHGPLGLDQTGVNGL